MSEPARASRGTWTLIAMAATAVAIYLTVDALSTPASSDAPRRSPSLASVPTDAVEIATAASQPRPIRPLSTRLRPQTYRGISPFCSHGRCCPTRVATYGTSVEITRVIAYFQRIGFRYAAPPLVASGSGDPRTTGSYLRWLGARDGNERNWRQANVAQGRTAGRPRWTTVYEVARARCTGPMAPHLAPEDWPRH